MIATKSYLGLLYAPDGTRLKADEWQITVENDELSIVDENGKLYAYNPQNAANRTVQEALFTEKRDLIENCLFGADINENSVNICRLRLWIELLKNAYYTQASGYTQLETLPNIDINIKCGNSLVSRYDVQVTSYEVVGTRDEERGTSGASHVEQSETSAEKRKLIAQYKKAVAQYKRESVKENKKAVTAAIAQIKNSIVEIGQLDLFDTEHNKHLAEGGIYKNSMEWAIEFPEVLDADGCFMGFDVVIGNPPYGVKVSKEMENIFKQKYPACQSTKGQKGSTDTFTAFINLGYNLIKKGSSLNFIVPMSVTSSDAMQALHKLLFDNCEKIKISNYAVRPEPVFDNAVVDVSVISFDKTYTLCTELLTTKMHRKKGDNFSGSKLVSSLQFTNSRKLCLQGRIPKIGSQIEQSILQKLFAHKKVCDYKTEKGQPIYYRTSGGRYFKVVTPFSTGSTKEKPFDVVPEYRDVIACCLSSNLGFWFYQIFSNNHDWKSYEIESFPVPALETLPQTTLSQIEELYKTYLEDIEKNANVRTSSGKSSYKVESFKEYKIVRSKSLIDQIDRLICPLYGLSAEETEFIINYELEFRMAGL